MQHLNLPEYQFNIKKKGNDGLVILDTLRKRWVVMNNEISLTQNGIKRRCDTLVADRQGLPLVIVEYKAPTIEISQKTFDQIVRYNMVLRAQYLIVTNGMRHYCCKIDYENNSYAFLQEIPPYNVLAINHN